MIETRMSKPLIFMLPLLLAGCADNKYVLTTDRLCTPTTSKQAIMTAAERVLAEMHFTVKKSDTEAGLIRTYPLPGSQSFEFWRSDSVGSFNQAEADLHSIRRTVEMNITEQAGELCINCTASTQRLSIDDDSQGSASNVEIRRSIQRVRDSHRQKTNITWTGLGRDAQLETEIIKRIQKKLAAGKRN
ncbi:MAG: hypothetical protein JW749_10320 [Sedimentisphaerales bacterium]|nr:hypothetical protein [Sedimentisphaerales bacterium]